METVKSVEVHLISFYTKNILWSKGISLIQHITDSQILQVRRLHLEEHSGVGDWAKISIHVAVLWCYNEYSTHKSLYILFFCMNIKYSDDKTTYSHWPYQFS
jgi:hypothetical protein